MDSYTAADIEYTAADIETPSQKERAQIPLAERLAAAGLSRLYKHMVRGPFALISGSRGQNDTDEERAGNNARARALRVRLRNLGYGYADARGIWREKGALPAQERSYFVPGMSEADAIGLGGEFSQDAVLVGSGGRFRVHSLVDPAQNDGTDYSVAEKFHMAKGDTEFYTGIGGKEFSLEDSNNPSAQSINSQTDFAPQLPQAEVPEPPPPAMAEVSVFPNMAKRAHQNPPVRPRFTAEQPHLDNKIYVPMTRFTSIDGEAVYAQCVYAHNSRPPMYLSGYGLETLEKARWVERSDLEPRRYEPIFFLPFREAGVDGADASIRLAQNSASDNQSPEHQNAGEPQEPSLTPLFVSQNGQPPALQDVPMTATHDDYVRSLSRQAQQSGSALDAARFIMDNPYGAQRDGLSSVWLDKSGRVHVMNPHAHTVSAFTAIADNLPPGYERRPNSLPMSKVDFRHLTKLSGGIMRGQFYPNGAGCSVDLQHPPTPAQLRSMEDYMATTSGEMFTAEVYDGGELVAHAATLAELRRLLRDAESGKSVQEIEAASKGCRFVRFCGGKMEGSVGGRIVG